MAAATKHYKMPSIDFASRILSQNPVLIAQAKRTGPTAADDPTARLFSYAHWAAVLTPEELAVARKGITERQFVRGSYICHRDSRLEYWTGVIDGLVKLSTISRDGRATTFIGIRSGGWFGEGAILKDEPRKYDIVAIQDTRLAMLNKATFDWLHSHSWGFRHFLIRQLNEWLGQLMSAREGDRLLSPTARLAQTLYWLFNPVLFPGGDLEIHISQEELAHLTGLSRATIGKSLKGLESKRVISGSRERITVLNLSGLSILGAR
jgi:CRP/FNR family transcriptional regulator, cyclic AMP receptor protein